MPLPNPYFKSFTKRFSTGRRQFVYINGQGLDASNSSSQIEFPYYEARTHGGSVPRWKQIIREGGDATTPLMGSRTKFDIRTGNLTFNFRKLYESGVDPFPFDDLYGGSEMTGVIATPMTGPSYTLTQVNYDKALNQALSRAINRINDAQTSFQGGVFLGELKETLHLIANPLQALKSRLGDYLSTVKKRRRNASKAAKRRILSDTWLEYSFGWKPLVNDIDDGFDALGDLTEGPIDAGHTAFRGSGKDEWIGDVGMKTETSTGTSCSWRVMREESIDVRIYGAMSNKILAEVGLPTKLGVGLSSFAPTLWELIPYSFLVDYFTNFGDIVNALSTNTSAVSWVAIGSKARACEYTYDVHTTVIPSSPAPGYATQGTGHPGSFRWEATSIARSRYVGSLVPSLELEVPPFDKPLKWLNMAALLARHQSLLPY